MTFTDPNSITPQITDIHRLAISTTGETMYMVSSLPMGEFRLDTGFGVWVWVWVCDQGRWEWGDCTVSLQCELDCLA
jgi:hypothetical protein